MDYTDLTQVKNAMDSQEHAADAILADYITKASRLIDRLVTGIHGVEDYFKTENVANELLTNGNIDYAGRLFVYPHKAIINSVTALSFRYSLRSAFTVANLLYVNAEREQVLYEGLMPYAERVYVQISYSGGLATSTAGLPKDLQDVATMMAVRLYKEARSGLGDSIGVAELGTLTYTKAFPLRAIETLQAYARVAPWM